MTSTIDREDLGRDIDVTAGGHEGDLAGTAPAPPEPPASVVGKIGPSDEAAAAPPRRARRRVAWPTVVCAALAAIGFAGTGYFAHAWQAERSTNAETAQVRSSAAGFVSDLTNFGPSTVGATFARIQSEATGSFATQARQFFGTSIRQELRSVGATSRGQLRDLFVESLGSTQATVFAVVDQTYVNDKMRAPAADTLRLELAMSHGTGGWRISAVTVLQSPTGFPSGSSPAVPGGKG